MLPPLQEADEMWDALVPSLACAAAYTGDLEALQVLVELVSLSSTLGDQPGHTGPGGGLDLLFRGLLSYCSRWGLMTLPGCPFPVAFLRWVMGPYVPPGQ